MRKGVSYPSYSPSETLNSIPCFHLFPKIFIGSTSVSSLSTHGRQGRIQNRSHHTSHDSSSDSSSNQHPTPVTEASMEDVATFVQPLAMIPTEGNSGGPVGATLRSADLPGQRPEGATSTAPAPLHVPPRLSRLQGPGYVCIVPMEGRPRKLRPRRGQSFSSSSRMEQQQDHPRPLRLRALLL